MATNMTIEQTGKVCLAGNLCAKWKSFRQSFDLYLTATESEKKDAKVIKKRFTEHFTPCINHAYERYKFNLMTQKEGETFTDYVTAASLQASRCNYGSLMVELFRDRIIAWSTRPDQPTKVQLASEIQAVAEPVQSTVILQTPINHTATPDGRLVRSVVKVNVG
ncbi:hypothetical protein MRX96_018029 [Rhipicephalus microplus]